jgi:Transposase IS116/IS110/IS902 family
VTGRRANGEGSIFPYRNGFAAYVWITTPSGKRQRKYVYGQSREIVHSRWVELTRKAAGPCPSTADAQCDVDRRQSRPLALRSPMLAFAMSRSRRTSCPPSGTTFKIMLAWAKTPSSFRPARASKSGAAEPFKSTGSGHAGPLGAMICAFTRFPTAGHLTSWAGLAAAMHESAGRRTPAGTRHGNRWLCALLVEAAGSVGRMHGQNYLAAQHARLMRRRGRGRAQVAVAHAILVSAYWMLKRGQPYHDLGADCHERRNDEANTRRLVAQLEKLGYTVTLNPAA